MQKHKKIEKKESKTFKQKKSTIHWRIKRTIPYTPHQKNFSFLKIKKAVRVLHIRIRSNNVFGTLLDFKKNAVLYSTSAGQNKLQVTRKRLRFVIKQFLILFLKKLKKMTARKRLVVRLSAPIKLRRFVLKGLVSLLKKKKSVISAVSNKCYNGCRPPKKKRSKRRRLRISKHS